MKTPFKSFEEIETRTKDLFFQTNEMVNGILLEKSFNVKNSAGVPYPNSEYIQLAKAYELFVGIPPCFNSKHLWVQILSKYYIPY